MPKSLIHRLKAGLAIPAAAFLMFGVSLPAIAESCAKHDEVVGLLEKKHQEKRQAIGLTGTGQLLEIFVSSRGTWTAVMSTPAGESCITATGEGWESHLAGLDPEV